MPKSKLIILSGPLGSGKSTLAKEYAQNHPLSLALDIDIIREMIGSWRELPEESAANTKKLAERMAHLYLSDGNDVIIPQIYRKAEYLDALKLVAKEAGAKYYEVLLELPKDEAINRFMKYKGIRPGGLIDRGGGVKKLEAMYDEMLELADNRPNTIRLMPIQDDIKQTYVKLVGLLK